MKEMDRCLFEKEKVEMTSKYCRPASPPPPEIDIAEIMGLTAMEECIVGKRKGKEMEDEESSLPPAKKKKKKKKKKEIEKSTFEILMDKFENSPSQLVSLSPPQEKKKELRTRFRIINKDKTMAEFYQKGFTEEEIEEAMNKIKEAMMKKKIKDAEESKRWCIFGESSLMQAKKKKMTVMTVKKTVLKKNNTTVKKKIMVKKKRIVNSDRSIPGFLPPYFFPSMEVFESYAKTLRDTDNYFVDPSKFPKNIADSGYRGVRPNIIPIIPRPVNYSNVLPTDEEITRIVLFALKQEEKKQNSLNLEEIKYCNQEITGMYRHYYITFEASSSSSSDDDETNNNQIIEDYQTKVCKNDRTGFLKLEQFRRKPQSSYF